MNETMKTLLGRRSVRHYRTDPVDKDKLSEIVKAGLYAPTGMGRQATAIVVVNNKEDRDQLSAMNAKVMGADTDPFYGAPTVIVVLAKADSRTGWQDGSAALTNMANAAYSLGFGSCWINRAKEEFESEEGKALLKKWGLEGEYTGIGHLIVGYADGQAPKAADRKEGRVFYV